MTDEPVRIIRLDPSGLRKLFNDDLKVLEGVREGRIREKPVESKHPSEPKAREPFCTQSQMISYIGPDGHEVARAHRYLRTDGTIGASGLPDPKRVKKDGVLYAEKSKKGYE